MSRSNDSHNEVNDEIDLLSLLGTLIEYRWFIVSVTTLFLIAGVAFALLSSPVYQANALVQVEERTAGLAGLDIMDGVFAGKSQVSTETGILKSRSLTSKVVDNLDLTTDVQPQAAPIIGNFMVRRFVATEEEPVAAAKFGLSKYDWGGSQIRVSHLNIAASLANQDIYLVAGEANTYELRIGKRTLLNGKVGERAEAKNISIQVDELIARAGTHFAVNKQQRSQVVKELQQKLNASEQGKMSGLMSLSYQHTNPLLAQAVLHEVTQIYVRQNIERASAEASSSLEFVRQQMPIIREEVEEAEKRLNAYQIDAKSIDINSETQSILNQLVRIETELSEVSLQQAEMDQLFTASHPTYQTFLNKKNILLAKKKDLESRISGLPELQQELLRLNRDVIVSSDIYTLLLQKAQELDIARASAVGNVRVIDEAETDSIPVKPKKKIVVLIATLVGGVLSVALAILHSLLNQGVRRAEEIEELGLPVYASIPFSEEQIETRGKQKLSHIPILAEVHPTDLAIEAFRSLRTSLHFTLHESRNKVLMITGPNPKVGKSFISINLSAVVAGTAQKVLLIDGDMRKGHLHFYFNNKNERGLSSLLSGQSDLAGVLQKTHIENLDFISRGPTPPNPAELLLSPRFEQLLEDMDKKYDLIVIDAPPVLAVTDAVIIGRLAGSNMMAVRFDENPVGEIEAAIKHFDVANVPLKGAIFNAVRRTPGSSYKYGYYNYQYSYKSD